MIILTFIPAFAIFYRTTSSLYSYLSSGRLSEKKGESIQPAMKTSFFAASKASHKLEK